MTLLTMPEVVILAGGPATRLYPVTRKVPKVMLMVSGKPFIAHQLSLLKRGGIGRAIILAGYLADQIQDFVKDGSGFGMEVKYSFDGKKLLGTGGAIKKALGLLGEQFFVMYGDSYLDTDLRKVNEYFCSQHKLGLMTILRNNDRWDKSNIVYKEGKILKYDKEKCSRQMKYIDYGLSLFKKEAFLNYKYPQAFGLERVFHNLIGDAQLAAYEVKERFFEIGSFKGLEEARKHLAKRG